MAILCENWQLLFVMEGNTGCSAVGNTLIEALGGHYLPPENVTRNGRMIFNRKHNTVDELLERGYLKANDLERLTIAGTVRNPFDRVASIYAREAGGWDGGMPRDAHGNLIEDPEARAATEAKAKAAQALGFDRWVARRYGWLARVRSRAAHRLGIRRERNFHRHVAVFLRFEHLQADFDGLLTRLGHPGGVAIPHSGKTSGKRPYPTYYSPRSRRIVARAFRDTIRRFGYTF
ncbi:MAG: hypothetical protein ACFE0O_07090 [Opitutales bacterium]